MRLSVTRVGLVAPPPGEPVVALDVRAAWPEAPERLARTDRVCHLALLASFRALGRPPEAQRPIAVVYGSALASLVTNVRYYEKIQKRGVRLADPKRFPYTAPNAAAGEVAIAFGLVGPNVSLTSGCASGVEALAVAARLVARGRAPAALAVAADAWSDEIGQVLALAAVPLPDGPREGAVAILVEPAGAADGLFAIDEVELTMAEPTAAPYLPSPVPLFAAAAPAGAVELSAACPLSGARARVRLSPFHPDSY